MLADRTLWREGAALDSADYHGADAGARSAIVVARAAYSLTQSAGIPQWQSEFVLPWIPRFGISIHLALDGLSLLMVVLTGLLGV
ncbi:hypothetical protein LFZ31_26095, partial [Salmonella enterica subsp. enterica serovar Newport str. S09097]